MDTFWQEFASEALQFLIALLVAAFVYVANRAATGFLRWSRAQADDIDNVLIGRALEAGITWAEVKLREKSGPEKLEWVMKYLEDRGFDIDEPEVEAYFQSMQKHGSLPVPKPAKGAK